MSSSLRNPRILLLVFTIPLMLVSFSTQSEPWTKQLYVRVSSMFSPACETNSALTALSNAAKSFDLEYLPDQAEEHIQEFFYNSQHVLCRDLQEKNDMSHLPLRVRYTFNCQDLHDHSKFGTGNWLVFLYNLRRAANMIGHVELHMECMDAAETKNSLILPWVMGTFEARTTWDLNREAACKPVWTLEGAILEDLRNDLRRMAIALVGLPRAKDNAPALETEVARKLQVDLTTSSLVSGLDDVAVHFRCGDILERSPHLNYGYARFQPLADLISETATSIGIVTQDFHGSDGQNDSGRCAILVEALQSQCYGTQHSNETIAVMYARFILAQQVITAGTSAYMTMPFRATFGTTSEVDRREIIDSVQIFKLWQEEDGRERVLELLTSSRNSL